MKRFSLFPLLLLFFLLAGCAQSRPLEETPPPSPRKIACVGDSLTYGAMLEGKRDAESYPAVLSSLLGEGYEVENFGVCGQELLGHSPLVDSQWYQASLDCQPDAVIFMLGTNDARETSWQGGEAFRTELSEILNAYLSLESQPELWLCTPAQLFVSEFSPYDPDLLEEIVTVTREVAEALDLPLIDIYELTEGQEGWYTYDGIHPNTEGYAAIGGAVYEAISDQ